VVKYPLDDVVRQKVLQLLLDAHYGADWPLGSVENSMLGLPPCSAGLSLLLPLAVLRSQLQLLQELCALDFSCHLLQLVVTCTIRKS